MKAIIYTRVASENQGHDNKGLKNQKELLKQYCKKHRIKIVEFFEEVNSGLNFNRPELTKLIEFTTKNKVDKIMITSRDRLGKNFEIVDATINRFKEMGVEVISIDNSDFNFITFLNIKL
jgi:site-specific DNA recombinase